MTELNRLDELNSEVTEAIMLAERLEDAGKDPTEAYRKVFKLESALADLHTPDSTEGEIARKGAVRAALKADDRTSAEALAQKYLNENGVVDSVRTEIENLLRLRAKAGSAKAFRLILAKQDN